MFLSLQRTIDALSTEFDLIPPSRKQILKSLASAIEKRLMFNQSVYLNFICTHNSRRSHVAQLWAQAAAHYYEINNVFCFSGGTEATAFNVRAIKAMRDAGFWIVETKGGQNPRYEVSFADKTSPVIAFSKKYDDPFNAANEFIAVMTCSQADENCPLVIGAASRISITYDDPKISDDTPQESLTYAERVHQIGREILYAFSLVRIQ